jgi:hypothetical protein
MTPTEDYKAILTRAASLFGPAQFEECLKLYVVDSLLHFLPPALPQGREGARLWTEWNLLAVLRQSAAV